MAAGITGIEYILPETRVSLETLEISGRLETGARRLREFGFESVRVSAEPAEALALAAAERLMQATGIDPASVSAIVHAGAMPSSHAVAGGPHVLQGFNYPVARLQYELGLLNASAIGVSQRGCTGLLTAIRVALGMFALDPSASRVLCTSADVLPPDAPREFIYNVISDGACALLVERDAGRNRILAYREVTKGYYWNSVEGRNEIIASYFPTAQRLVRATLDEAGLAPADVTWVLPHNVSLRSWEILLRLIDVPRDRLFADNIGDKGHVIAADNFINLRDASDRGLIGPGDRLLLFGFGFGAHWSCMILEH